MPHRSWESRRATVATNFLFANLTAAELDKVLALARVTRYAPRATIWRKGDAGNGMMAVLSGHVKLGALVANGREFAFGIVKPGEIFGEIALLDGQERAVDATALDTCEILFVDRRDFIPFLADHPDISIRLMTALCARLRRTSQMVEDSALGLSPKLARNLLHLADCHGQPAAGGGLHISLRLSQRELGGLIGISRESVNKQLGRWRRQGLITVGRRTIVIRDFDSFQRMADLARTIN
ncbi:MAG: Crp/Fnr family transcriptional regulator [Rhodospirillales bacterium]|nr:Crp/Fnr family transcriptional regulator [Rhodospirillales bacterium]MSP80887.1 Crp/Fnr family transcriptional regulator [Rhodospirillales bacterium]